MIKTLLLLHFKQLFRSLNGIGLFRQLFLAGLVAFIGFVVFVSSAVPSASVWLSLIFLAFVGLIHLKRNDKTFLKTNFARYRLLMLAEYAALATPVAACLIVHAQWLSAAVIAGIVPLAHLETKPSSSSLNTRLQASLPNDAIEWKAGLRKQFFLIVPLWILAVFTSFFIGSVPVALFLLGIAVLGFHEQCESLAVLFSYELGAVKLLRLKIVRQLQLYSLMVLPLIALFLVFHPDRWYIPAAEYVLFCCLQVYAVVVKYAFYQPNNRSSAAQLFVGFGIVGCLMAVFLPVVWLLTAWFYNKSVNNLNQLLDDYH